jgi:hypothetical protein
VQSAWIELCHGGVGEVAAGDDPLVVLLGEDRADEAERRIVGGENAHDVGPPLDLLVQPLDQVVRPDLAPVIERELPERQHITLGLSHRRGRLREPGGETVGDLVQAVADLVGGELGEDGPERGGDHLGVRPGDRGQQVAGVVDPAALP